MDTRTHMKHMISQLAEILINSSLVCLELRITV